MLVKHFKELSRNDAGVGTLIATKVFNTGDVVEVDAERGIVTILKKASEHQKTKETQNGDQK